MPLVTVGTTATLLVAANPDRIGLILKNQGTGEVFIGEDDTVTNLAYDFSLDEDQVLSEDSGGTKMFAGNVYGIVASGTSDVSVWERDRKA